MIIWLFFFQGWTEKRGSDSQVPDEGHRGGEDQHSAAEEDEAGWWCPQWQ